MKKYLSTLLLTLNILYPRECLIQHDPDERSTRPEKDTYVISPSGHFYIHYDTTGNAAPDLSDFDENGVPDFVDEVGMIADSTHYVLVEQMGYNEEPYDGEGGYDIYIMSYGAGVYGYTYSEGNGISYIQIDNDYVGFNSMFNLTPIQIMQVSIAHEYSHGIQFGYRYNISGNAYFYEMSAMWFEDVLLPDANDYLDGWVDPLLENPTAEFDNIGQGYELALFGHYLSSFLDPNGVEDAKNSKIIRVIWEYFGETSSSAFLAIENVLSTEYEVSFIEAWTDFISRNLYNGRYENMDNNFYYYIDQALIDPIATNLQLLIDSETLILDLDDKSVAIRSFQNINQNGLLDISHSSNNYYGRISLVSSDLNFWATDTAAVELSADSDIHFIYGTDDNGSSVTVNLTIDYNDVIGCTDLDASNFNPDATIDDGSCEYDCDSSFVPNCNPNYESEGVPVLECCSQSWIGDGNPDCVDQEYGCDLTCYENDGGDCSADILGCLDIMACNYNSEATLSDGTCWYPIAGCTCNDGQEAVIDECGVCNGTGAVFDCGCNDCCNMQLAGYMDFGQGTSDITGFAQDGREFAVVGLVQDGAAFVDITDPENPFEVGRISGTPNTWRDLKYWNRHVYIGTEANDGIKVVSVDNPDNPILIYTITEFGSSHNIHIDADGYLYIIGADYYDIWIYELTDHPAIPQLVGTWNGSYLHDIEVFNNKLYGAAISSGKLYIIDVSDKNNPTTLISYYTGFSPHDCAVTYDENYLIMADETSGGHIKIWDISDYNNINLLSEYMTDSSHSVHNVYIRPETELIIMSYYVDGTRVLDISDPANPVEVGYFDTSGLNGLYDGNWGTYAYLPSGYIISSDRQNGLFIFDSPLTNPEMTWSDCSITIIQGDVNSDGEINILDIVILVDTIMSGDEFIPSGDINGDGYLNIMDVVQLVNLVLDP